MTGICIICEREHSDTTIEHIIPRSLGNIHYILPKGKVCSQCNHRFSKYENRVLSSTKFLQERSRLGLLHKSNQQDGKPLAEHALVGFLLKMGYEGIYKSRPKLLKQFNLDPVREYLVAGGTLPFARDLEMGEITILQSIPRWLQAFRLRNGRMKLQYIVASNDQLFVQFQLGRLVIKTRMV